MSRLRAGLGLLFLLSGASVVSAFEGEVGVTVGRTLATVVLGPPGSPAQEVGSDRTKVEAVASHKQPLGFGLSAEASGLFSLDTLPSQTPLLLPESKVEATSRLLEAWLAWEPLPGVLALGAGKRRVQTSSGFSAKPLDALGRSDDREGRTGLQAAWYGDWSSVSVFGGPAWQQDGTPDPFLLGRAGVSWGTTDVKLQVFQSSGAPRGGVGADGSWGDHLTLRAEAAADLDLSAPRHQALAGFTWTTDDLSTLMAEVTWEATKAELYTGFFRGTLDLAQDWEAQTWVKAQVTPSTWTQPSGWMGLGLSWKAPRWTLDAGWSGAWGPPGTVAGDSPFRWKTELTAKVLL